MSSLDMTIGVAASEKGSRGFLGNAGFYLNQRTLSRTNFIESDFHTKSRTARLTSHWAWRFGADTMLAYATAKAAVMGLTRALARGYGDDNIRVNAIDPGAVMTEKQRKLWYPAQESVDNMVARQILKHVLLGEDIARMALFLGSDDSRMITKQSFIVDAGLA